CASPERFSRGSTASERMGLSGEAVTSGRLCPRQSTKPRTVARQRQNTSKVTANGVENARDFSAAVAVEIPAVGKDLVAVVFCPESPERTAVWLMKRYPRLGIVSM